MATQWPLVVARLVELLPTLPGWSAASVIDGQQIADLPAGPICTVGFVEDDSAGSYSEATSMVGNVFSTEDGEVRCRLVTAAGEAEISGPRVSGFALIDALRDYMRATPLLGILPPGSTTALSVQVASAQNAQGAGQRLDFTLSYSCPVI